MSVQVLICHLFIYILLYRSPRFSRRDRDRLKKRKLKALDEDIMRNKHFLP